MKSDPVRRSGRCITRQCSGPGGRASLLWFERRRGAGSATERPYVMSQQSVHPALIGELERAFGVRFDVRMLETWTPPIRCATIGATPTEVYAWVTRTLAATNVPVPDDCWPRVRGCVTRAALAASTGTTGSFKAAT